MLLIFKADFLSVRSKAIFNVTKEIQSQCYLIGLLNIFGTFHIYSTIRNYLIPTKRHDHQNTKVDIL